MDLCPGGSSTKSQVWFFIKDTISWSTSMLICSDLEYMSFSLLYFFGVEPGVDIDVGDDGSDGVGLELFEGI